MSYPTYTQQPYPQVHHFCLNQILTYFTVFQGYNPQQYPTGPQHYPANPAPQYYPANPGPQYYPPQHPQVMCVNFLVNIFKFYLIKSKAPKCFRNFCLNNWICLFSYRDAPPQNNSQWNDPNTCWLISLLTLCCGCLISEACCDSNVCCCLIPCALPRFGPRRYWLLQFLEVRVFLQIV